MKRSFLHRVISIALILVLFLGIFKTMFTISNFLINQDEIAKTLCVQKDNQQGCFGKCQLVIALKKDLEQEDKVPSQKTQKLTQLYNFIKPISELNLSVFTTIKYSKIGDGRLYEIIDREDEIFIPPPLS